MRRSILIIAVVSVLFGITAVAWAVTGPGTEADPVVSRSYVDAKTAFIPIELAPGQKLIGTGSTEIILRSGEATAIDNGENGISDLTSGTDLMTGNQVVSNHLLLVPRDDGRGITALTEAWVLVRGDYTVQ
jgi:hypothetical protein